jgi:hypothetical protein
VSDQIGGLTLRPALLEPDEPDVRDGMDVPAPVEGPISLGGPDWAELTEVSLDNEPQAAEFVRSQPDARFFRLEMAVTVAPRADEPIDTFWITTTMRRGDGEGGPEPIAWSMKPDRVEDEVTQDARISFGPQLEIVNLSFELGTSRVRKEIVLEARFLRQPTPQWVVRKTGGSSITGSQLFILVARFPRGQAVEGEIAMNAIVYRKRWGLLKHRVRLPDRAAERFTVPA